MGPGSADVVVADGAAWEIGTLGKLGAVPGWPGREAFAPQPAVTQIRAVLDADRDRGGSARAETYEGSGHFPPIDAPGAFRDVFLGLLDSAAAR